MAQPILYVDTSSIREGKLAALEPAMENLARFVEAKVPQILSYAFYLDSARSRMTVVALHPDSASLEFHMEAGAAEFRKFAELIRLERIDVYGRVSDRVRERLHAKARVLGPAEVTLYERCAGFERERERL